MRLAPVVKSNAYGHGLRICSQILREAGADFLTVNSLEEAAELREFDQGRILVAGYVELAQLKRAAQLKLDLTIYNLATLQQLAKLKIPVRLHLKVETGTNRQGILPADLPKFLALMQGSPQLKLVGLSTHFADLEDSHQHNFAFQQLAEFEKFFDQIQRFKDKAKEFNAAKILRHAANSAASLVLPPSHFELVRPGIAIYGLYPADFFRSEIPKVRLKPVLTFKTRVAQIKVVPAGQTVGYGRTYYAKSKTRIAILPVGYFDGLDRKLSNCGAVLIADSRAPILGRVCMNITMVDITKIPQVRLEDEVILLGCAGGMEISAEEIAEKTGTINYEVVARLRENLMRKVV